MEIEGRVIAETRTDKKKAVKPVNESATEAVPAATKEKKSRVNVEAKPPLDEERMKQIINEEYSKANTNFKVVQQAVDNMTHRYADELLKYVAFADDSLELVITEEETDELDKHGQPRKKKKYEMKFNLTEDDLSFLAIKLPTACIYVQEFINARALDTKIAEYMVEDAITENLKHIEGGDAKERARFAAQAAEIEQIVALVKNQVYTNLKSYIDRADKVYEGVKKVLDGINKEKVLFGKSNKFSA